MPEAVRLLIASDEGADERVVTLPVAFGRDPDRADVVLPDRMVSRRHASLEAEGDRLVLLDLESANGTWVRGEPVERRLLDPEDVVTLGAHTVRWAWVEPVPPATEPPRAVPSFGSAGGVVLDAAGLRFMPLAELYTAWDVAERRLGEIAEELARDGISTETTARLDAHDRCAAAVDALLDAELDRVALPTIALCAPDVEVAQFRARLAAIRALPAHAVARAASAGARRDGGGAADDVAAVLLEEDRRLVDALSEALLDALDAITEHAADVTRHGATRLMGALRGALVAVGEADGRVAERAGGARGGRTAEAADRG